MINLKILATIILQPMAQYHPGVRKGVCQVVRGSGDKSPRGVPIKIKTEA